MQGLFAIWVYRPEQELFVDMVGNVIGTSSDVSYLYLGLGTYYLVIEGTLNTWDVSVEVQE